MPNPPDEESPTGRGHLFISYATEDSIFVDWLALRLAAAGYRVWYDRLELLGGESYPRDIDRAIAELVFRFIAVVSKTSLNKPNPRKERTQALNISRARGIDFLIPLKIDKTSVAELGWQLSDLTYIPFDSSWSDGLSALLRRLESLGTPKDEGWGRGQVAKWLTTFDCVRQEPERVWSNLFPIKALPTKIQLFKTRHRGSLAETDKVWPIARQDESSYWAFSEPEEGLGADGWATSHIIDWKAQRTVFDRPTRDIASILVRRAIELDSTRRGLRILPEWKEVCFPPGLLPSDRLYYTGYDGKRTWIQVTGERSRKRKDKSIELSRYQLSFGVRPVLFGFGEPVFRLFVSAHFKDADGVDFGAARQGKKRKALGRSWWNYEWLSRVMACGSWLTQGNPSATLLKTPSGEIVIGGIPLSTSSPVRIDEATLAPVAEPEELTEEDDGDDEEDEEDESSASRD